ncbi:MAG TPA: class I SAM-dependent methyltransferase [Acidimicrobiales bacterium]|jgi:hypothetical protein|nr:class I SAM-dependent methyltransferase [Acidimicrobiales bacterium]
MPDDEGLALYRAGVEAVASVPGPAGPGGQQHRPLLEVGTYCGKSAIYLGAAARAGRTTLFSVDHHRGSEENQPGWEHHDPTLLDGSGLLDTLPSARRTIAEAGLETEVVLVVGGSTTVARFWSTPLALVFIDGGHGADVAWADYRVWAPKVATGGRLAIHDVFPDPADGGRAPYEIYREALASGCFDEDVAAGRGSLRVLRRR